MFIEFVGFFFSFNKSNISSLNCLCFSYNCFLIFVYWKSFGAFTKFICIETCKKDMNIEKSQV